MGFFVCFCDINSFHVELLMLDLKLSVSLIFLYQLNFGLLANLNN